MARHQDTQVLESKSLCSKCVGETFLRAEIQKQGRRRRCSYCNRPGRTYSIDDLAKRIKIVFAEHYSRTSDQPDSWESMLLSDRDGGYTWERHGEPVIDAIENAADIPRSAAQDIQEILDDEFYDFESAQIGEETEFSSDAYYEEKGASDQAWQADWSNFERALKTEARFFSRSAAAHLGSVFSGIDSMSASDGRPLVVDAGPGSTLKSIYRARVFQSNDQLITALCRPDLHLGSPPAVHAIAGRMNARGISVFYGANDPGVAIAEVRPPVGSQVAVARFAIVRPLRLLDLTALSVVHEKGSVFDPRLASRTERAVFLRSLSQRITRPVMPDDEVFEYLPTQAIADFLATEIEPSIDGILFPSAQAAGKARNIVLFHKAARAEAIDLPSGADVRAHTYQMTSDGPEADYAVMVRTQPKEPAAQKSDDGDLQIGGWMSSSDRTSDSDRRLETLRIELESLQVHEVLRVELATVEHAVRWHSWEEREPEF